MLFKTHFFSKIDYGIRIPYIGIQLLLKQTQILCLDVCLPINGIRIPVLKCIFFLFKKYGIRIPIYGIRIVIFKF